MSSGRVTAFRVPERRRLHEEVGEQLRDAIIDGRFRPGEKLPPERDLAAQFGVNRTSVREAIKGLEALGLVSVRQGDGATVQPLVDASLDLLGPMVLHGGRIDRGLLAELAEVMLPLLLEMGGVALRRAEPKHVAGLRALRDVVADEGRGREDRARALHDILVYLADMTGNRVWQMFARRTRDMFGSEAFRETRARLDRQPGRLVGVIDRSLDALEAADEPRAMEALGQLIHVIGAEFETKRRSTK